MTSTGLISRPVTPVGNILSPPPPPPPPQDGTCIIHTVRHGRYTHTLCPREESNCEIRKVSISGLGRIVVYSEDPHGRAKVQSENVCQEVRVTEFCSPNHSMYSPPHDPVLHFSFCLQTVFTVPPCLHVFNINGKRLQQKELSESLNDLVIVDKYLITGNARGFLSFRDLYRSVSHWYHTTLHLIS